MKGPGPPSRSILQLPLQELLMRTPANPSWIEFAINPKLISEHISNLKNGVVKGPSGEELFCSFLKLSSGHRIASADSELVPSKILPNFGNRKDKCLRIAMAFAAEMTLSLQTLIELTTPIQLKELLGFAASEKAAFTTNNSYETIFEVYSQIIVLRENSTNHPEGFSKDSENKTDEAVAKVTVSYNLIQ